MPKPSEADRSRINALSRFATRTRTRLYPYSRVRALWLTGSLADGTADAHSDVDLRIVVSDTDFAQVNEWWHELIDRIATTIWKRRWPDTVDGAIVLAITPDYLRFDVAIFSTSALLTRSREHAKLLFDKDGISQQLAVADSPTHNPLGRLSDVVSRFIRLLGMLTIVVNRNDVPLGMESLYIMYSMLVSILLMENGIDRLTTGKRHIVSLLNKEQRAVLARAPIIEPTLDSVIQGHLTFGRIFLPRARRLMESNALVYPEAFEIATRQHVYDVLGLTL